MATAALVIQWGRMARAREQQALRVWGEVVQYWQRLQEQGQTACDPTRAVIGSP
mgnify:CR=1 FL=1